MRASEIFLALLLALGAVILLGIFIGGLMALAILAFFYFRTRRLEKEDEEEEPLEAPVHNILTICSNCRKEILADSKTCEECGVRLSNVDPM
jgi:hypothetical protein